MRHGNRKRKLSRPTDQRMALLYGIVTALIINGKVKVTVPRAKEARKIADKIITLAKYGDLASRRKVFSIIRDRDIVKKIFTEIPSRYEGRPGGYTRIVKIAPHLGDAAPMALLELV
jgi:large subunit ribosomal protein L17